MSWMCCNPVILVIAFFLIFIFKYIIFLFLSSCFFLLSSFFLLLSSFSFSLFPFSLLVREHVDLIQIVHGCVGNLVEYDC